MSFKQLWVIALLILSLVYATPCPYGQLAERGELPEPDAVKFFAARDEGAAALMHKEREAEFTEQEQFPKRQLDLGGLLGGLFGGLLNGVLQPLGGILADLEIPIPQASGLRAIPGNDPLHQYIAPTQTDVRGPCVALNTMANHGYISRSGITNFAEVANGCQVAFGWAYDICTVLSALGLLSGGDLVSGMYSIGGEDARVPNTLGPSLGISRHGFFEVDNSITREDAYFGNPADFRLSRWNALVEITQKYDGQFGNAAFGEERVATYQTAIATNPEFNAGIRWVIGSVASRCVVFRTFPNGTDLSNANYENIAPFYLNESFPENWYRRGSPYSLAELVADMATLIVTSPILTVPGSNQGVNNFVPLGLDLSSITPATVTCFLAVTIQDELPGILEGASAELLGAVQSFINGVVAPFFPGSGFECAAIAQYANAGPDVGATPGVSTEENILTNGVYS